MSEQMNGIALKGSVRGSGVNPKTGKPYIYLELTNSFGVPSLFKVTTKGHGQKVGDQYQGKVELNIFEGKFYGFREI